MMRSILLLIWITPLLASATDSSSAKHPSIKLKGYKRILYNVVLLHPKMNSPFEKELLKHYLLGSGTTYEMSDDDFSRLKQSVAVCKCGTACLPGASSQAYCISRFDLNADAYFGWALGNAFCIYETATGQLVSVADIYDFNRAKAGVRKLKNELITRIFRLLSPASAKSFVVTYKADGFVTQAYQTN